MLVHTNLASTWIIRQRLPLQHHDFLSITYILLRVFLLSFWQDRQKDGLYQLTNSENVTFICEPFIGHLNLRSKTRNHSPSFLSFHTTRYSAHSSCSSESLYQSNSKYQSHRSWPPDFLPKDHSIFIPWPSHNIQTNLYESYCSKRCWDKCDQATESNSSLNMNILSILYGRHHNQSNTSDQ